MVDQIVWRYSTTVSNKEICKLDTHEETHCPFGLHLHDSLILPLQYVVWSRS